MVSIFSAPWIVDQLQGCSVCGRGANSASSTPVSCGVRSVEEGREVMARNTLFLAVTRPALFAGIPIEAAVVILLTSGITLIGTTTHVYGPVVAARRFGIAASVGRHVLPSPPPTFPLGTTT